MNDKYMVIMSYIQKIFATFLNFVPEVKAP